MKGKKMKENKKNNLISYIIFTYYFKQNLFILTLQHKDKII